MPIPINVISLAMRLLRNRDQIPEIGGLLDRLSPDKPAPSQYPVGSVSWLQESLNTVSNAGLDIDGDIGALTRDAIEDYQQEHGLEVDGFAGPETLNSIVEELAKSGR